MGVAVVTGAGQGLGRAMCQRLASDGFDVVAVDLNAETASETASLVGGASRQCDVSDAVSVQRMAASVPDVDVLVNNAGIWRFANFLDITPEDAQAVINVSVLGTLYCSQAFIPTMIDRGAGAIVNVSSIAAFSNAAGVGIYPAAKQAVISLTKQMALEFGPSGIRSNAVGPGLIVTEATAAQYGPENTERRKLMIPLRQIGEPEDVADVVSFLCGHDGRYVSGQMIYVDGGFSAGNPGPAEAIDRSKIQ